MIEIKDSAVLRDGVQIGVIDGDTCNSTALISGIIKGQIRKAAGNSSLAFVVNATNDHEETEEETPVIKAPLSGLPRLIAETETHVIPPPPPTRPDMGDKTPAYVEWFRRYSTPEEFEKKYPPNRRLVSEQEADAAESKRRQKAEQVEVTFKV